MKSTIAELVTGALRSLPDLADAAADIDPLATVERARDASHGDFASNIAMRLAKPARRKPRDIAAAIVAAMPEHELIAGVDIAGPGFINFRLADAAFHALVGDIIDLGRDFGRQPARTAPKILLEFVSANPTGPLHVGHGRHAAYGATLGNLLEAAGYSVHREYYVNDAGRQMDILGTSVWLRWLGMNGIDVPFPKAGYRGDYIRDIAAAVGPSIGAHDSVTAARVLDGIPADGADDSDTDTAEQRDANKQAREAHAAALIARATDLLGADEFDRLRQQSLEAIRADIEDDLAGFGVDFDEWYSEQSLTRTGRVDDALAVLAERGMLYEKDGATWFPATRFGDEKDRVVVRDNGIKTYFASDIAYHFDKRERGYDLLIDVLGSDHHGYVSRVRAGLEAMGYDADDLEVRLMQFVVLYRGGEKVQMSTRSGKFDTLRKLRAEVGNDAARFYYVSRSNDQHLDFDLDVAKSQSNDNPVYYIQYAHARIASVFRELADRSLDYDAAAGRSALSQLGEAQEKTLLATLGRYPEVIELAAANRAPQHLVHYLRDVANDFHSWYNAAQFIVDDAGLRNARLALAAATRVVIANGLELLGVSAPERM